MLGRLRPQTYDFFDLFDRHADVAHNGLKLICDLVQNWPNSKELIQRIVEAEHQCDSITHMTVDLMRRTYLTPFDRNEIRELISRMDDVIDNAQGAASRIILFKVDTIPEEMKGLTVTLTRAHGKVVEAVRMLRKIKKADGIEELCREINSLENEGDDLMRRGLANLFTEVKDPIAVIKLKEIFEMLERAVDCCEDVANVIEGIIIEHRG